MEEKFDGYIQQVKKTQEYYKTKNPVAKDDEVNLTYAEIKAIAAGQKNLQPDEKWQLKKQYAEKRLESLNKKLNENFPDKLIAIFKDGLKVHCPHGKVKQFDENGKNHLKTDYYSGLNAIILAAEMQEKNYPCSSFVSSRTIYSMKNLKNLSVEEKAEEKSTEIFETFKTKSGDKIFDTRQVFNVAQLEGKDAPPEITVINPRQDFMLEKTLDGVLNKIEELKSKGEVIDLNEIAKQSKQNAFDLCREKDALKQQRIDSIKNVDLSVKPKTNAEKLQFFCKKAMEGKSANYKGYVVDGVKRFLLSTPSVKLEQMTKLIDAVAPAAVFNAKNYAYSDFVKSAVRNDKNFAAKLQEVKNSRSNFSR